MSTSGDVQYIGRYHDACGGHHEYIGGNYEYIRGCSDIPPYVLMVSPDVLKTHYAGCNCLIVCLFWEKSGKYYYDKHQWEINAVIKRKIAVIVLGFYLIRGSCNCIKRQ